MKDASGECDIREGGRWAWDERVTGCGERKTIQQSIYWTQTKNKTEKRKFLFFYITVCLLAYGVWCMV